MLEEGRHDAAPERWLLERNDIRRHLRSRRSYSDQVGSRRQYRSHARLERRGRRFEATLEETDVISLHEAHCRRAVGAGQAAGTRTRAAHEGSPGLTPATSGGGDRGRPSGLPFRFSAGGSILSSATDNVASERSPSDAGPCWLEHHSNADTFSRRRAVRQSHGVWHQHDPASAALTGEVSFDADVVLGIRQDIMATSAEKPQRESLGLPFRFRPVV